MWDLFRFKESPYDTRPLRVERDDAELLIGRQEEGREFQTIVDAYGSGVLVISGNPGVGKTSFFNVMQYLIETGSALYCRKMLAARELCPVQSGDSPREIALRALRSACRSVERYCSMKNIPIPSETKKIANWLNSRKDVGFNFNITILGTGGGIGRQVTLSDPQSASFEAIRDAIECVAAEVEYSLNFTSMFVALDNTESLSEDHLANFLMSFRDTMFVAKSIWWVVIGPSGLGSSLRTIDSRVAERLSGSIELDPISSRQLHDAIDKRVKKFHSSPSGKAPLSEIIHDHLYRASVGEIRYVFQQSNQICINSVSRAKQAVEKILGLTGIFANKEQQEKFKIRLENSIEEMLVNDQISDKVARNRLKEIIEKEIEGLKLTQSQRRIMKKIGTTGAARSSEYKKFGAKSGQDFSSNFLVKFHQMKLLTRTQEGKTVSYTLRGTAALAAEYGLL